MTLFLSSNLPNKPFIEILSESLYTLNFVPSLNYLLSRSLFKGDTHSRRIKRPLFISKVLNLNREGSPFYTTSYISTTDKGSLQLRDRKGLVVHVVVSQGTLESVNFQPNCTYLFTYPVVIVDRTNL